MRIKSFLFLLIFLTSHLYANAPQDPYEDIIYYQLQNGMKVYMLSDPLAVNTDIEVVVNVGMDVENEESAGISHLVEHLIFRDQRVAHHDYLDYLKDEGASYVNGYTRRYNTSYVASMDANRSYWLVETFAQMLFDKNITTEDLEIERDALQVEIGEMAWYHPIANALHNITKLFPKPYYILTSEFKNNTYTLLPTQYYYIRNNSYFNMPELLKHYNNYYYPANMTLKIAGNFDTEMMQQHIQTHFGTVEKNGTLRAKEPPYNATMSDSPTYLYSSNTGNSAQIGIKYLLNDYKDYLMLRSYHDYLSDTLQQHLRNRLGQSYSVSSFNDNFLNAAIAGVSFDSLHDTLKENLAIVKEHIESDVSGMSHEAIEKALSDALIYYDSLEHDAKTLMDKIDTIEYMHKYHNLYNTTPYALIRSITPEYFQETLRKYYVPQHRYSDIDFDYYFFPYDMMILSFLCLFLVIWGYVGFSKLLLKRSPFSYSQREILFTRRLSNRFISFMKFVLLFGIAIIILDWVEFVAANFWLEGTTLDYAFAAPYDYLYAILSSAIFWILFVTLGYLLFRTSYVKLDATKERLNLLGTRFLPIEKSAIVQIKKAPWHIKHIWHIHGAAFLFYKPLVQLTCKDGKVYYLRSNQADYLVEDLQKWHENEA